VTSAKWQVIQEIFFGTMAMTIIYCPLSGTMGGALEFEQKKRWIHESSIQICIQLNILQHQQQATSD
jgi:hypothetical protein